ncbi:MAG: Ig-like domain-containing protein [Verrucomicrobia bacterium]|nr:Ig-like domain-containing protein [Verrucomicrobiota bacterium]
MKTMNQSYRQHPGLCAAAILACLSATARAAPIFTENFNSYAGNQNNTQSQTGLPVAHTGSVTGWSRSGAGTMHAVRLSASPLNWAIMFYQDNVITLTNGIAANTLGVTYKVDFDYGTADYAGGQATAAADSLLVEVVRAAGTTLASNTYAPGAWSNPTNVNLSAGLHGTLTYVGDGSGVVRLRIGPTAPFTTNRFEGEIDNLSVSEANPTLASSGIVDDKGGASVTTGTLVTYTVTFSGDMDATTVDAADFGNAGTAGVSLGTVTETAPASGVFTVPVTTTSAGTLQLKVNAGAVLNDAGGLPLITTSAIADDTTLTVVTPGDTTPPTLTSIADDKSPGAAERNALVTYTVTFNEAMDGGTVAAADFGNAGSAAVTLGTVTQTAAAVFTVQVTPTTTGTLQLKVNAGAELKDVAGNALVTTSAIPDDTTLAVNDTIAPTLTGIVDDKSPATIAPNTLVTYTVAFSEDMDAGTVSAADFGNPGSADVTIGTVTETTPGVFTVQATPTSGGTLRLQVNQDAELKDAAGNALVTTSAILDDTTITVDGTPPTIATLSPADDATGAVLNANLVVTFSEVIAIGTTGDITIKNLTDNTTHSTIAITDGSQVSVAGAELMINPTEDLLAGKDYVIQIGASAIQDLYGNFFAGIGDDTTWNFTAGNLFAFTSAGTTSWSAPAGVTSVGVLVVGGGGGGGWHTGAGGGAGGLVFSGAHAVSPGGSYSVTVGAGGLGSVNRGNPNCDPPTSGGNSSFDTLTAVGGGYGAYSTWAAHYPAAAGGSGGGGYMSNQFGADRLPGGAGTSGQGNAGANGVNGSYSGGGGGAGAAGSTRNGGNGLNYSSLSGTGYGVSGWFAGGGGSGATTLGATAGTGGTGGGGAGAPAAGSAANGVANTGGGGGGGGEGNGICGNGGSGIVLLSVAGFTPPVVATLNPADNATAVADTANLVVTFDQTVQAGTGNLEIRKSGDDSLIEAIAVTSGLVTIAGAEATINPSANLPAGTECYVQIPAGAVKAASGSLLPFAGITDTTTWSFTTAGPPLVATLNPADNAAGVLSDTNLVVTFDQAVQAGTGNLEIRKSGDDSLIESIDVTSGLVTISGASVTIDPSANLPVSTGCYVQIPAGAFTATIGSLLPFAGITDTTMWNFTTVGPVLADARADFQPTTAGGTTADFNDGTGLSDTQGSGRWNYLNGAASTLLTFGGAGNAGHSMYMTTGQTNGLPAIGDQQIFSDVPAPAAGKIQWHAGDGTQNAVLRWTAGADVTNLAIAGTIARGTTNGYTPEFDILVNGVNRFTLSLPNTTPHTFAVTGLSVSAGQNVDFVLSRGIPSAGGAIADLQATISGELSAAGGYASWAATNAPTGTPGADYDGDGVSNGVEYVLGGTKDTNDLDKLPRTSTSGGDLFFIFERDPASIDGSTTVVIEVGTDLATWTPYAVPDGATGPVNPGVTVVKDWPVVGKDTVTLTVPQAPDSSKFARLKVTVP